jgi:hypothetical protein
MIPDTLNAFHRRLYRRIQKGAQCTLVHRVKRNGGVHRVMLLVLPDGRRGSCYYKTAQALVDEGMCEWVPDGPRQWALKDG